MVFYKNLNPIIMEPKVLYGVGLGPGDPKWVTLEAISILNQSNIVAFITGLKGQSRAEKIGKYFLKTHTKKLFLKMPNTQSNSNNQDWQDIANNIQGILKTNDYCSIACLGDPLMYGSFTQILSLLPPSLKVNIIPGLWSGSVAASKLTKPWVKYNDSLVIISSLLDKKEMSKRINNHDSIVFLKVSGCEKKIYSILKDNALHKNSWLIQELGTTKQTITPFTKESKADTYFALILASKI